MKQLAFTFLLLTLALNATAQTIRQPSGARVAPAATFTPDDEVRVKITNDLAINLVEGKFNLATNSFDATLKNVLKEDGLRAYWYQMTSWRGSFVRIENIVKGQEQGLLTINVVCRFDNAYALVVATFKEKQVAGFAIR